MARSKLRDRSLKNKTEVNESVYKKQTNYCVRLYKKKLWQNRIFKIGF